FDHLLVFDAGADQQPGLGAVEYHYHGGEHDESHHHGDEAELLDRHVADEKGAAQGRGPRQRQQVGPPEDVDQLLGDDHAAGGDENLLEMLPVDRPDDDALESQAQYARDQHRREQRWDHRAEVDEEALR